VPAEWEERLGVPGLLARITKKRYGLYSFFIHHSYDCRVFC
jgi:hypothetical protein